MRWRKRRAKRMTNNHYDYSGSSIYIYNVYMHLYIVAVVATSCCLKNVKGSSHSDQTLFYYYYNDIAP